MGFWDIVGKVIYGIGDFAAETLEQHAKSIDRMSDEEIEKKYFRSAQKIRRDAATLSDMELEKRYFLSASEVRRDADEMSNEDLEIKYFKSADEVRMEADMLRIRAEMYQMQKQKRNKPNEDESPDFECYDESECYNDFD